MAENGISLEGVVAIHKRNLEQDRDLNVSQRAVDTYYKVTGHHERKPAEGVTINFTIEQ